MILKGSQRGSGGDLARHLMRTDDNEHVRLHELRGFTSGTLKGAFKEIEAVSLGTRCRQYLFSLSLSPPEEARVPVAAFERAIERIEGELGLAGQPRAVVFHEKEGRRHAHCVWSRIDPETMTARPLPFFKRKLMGLARDLYLEHGWTMPRGFVNAAERDPLAFTLAEWQQAKRQGADPRWLKAAVQACWATSDDGRSFAHSLERHGCFLARGDRRGVVLIDHMGDVHALARVLNLKTKDVRARLGDGSGLPGVEAMLQDLGARMVPALRRHVAQAQVEFRTRLAPLGREKEAMTNQHRQARQALDERHKAEWEAETRARSARLRGGLVGLWHRLTGRHRETRRRNEAEAQITRERQAMERQLLVEGQLEERTALQGRIKDLRHRQAERLLALRQDVGRFMRFTRGGAAPTRSQDGGPDRAWELRHDR